MSSERIRLFVTPEHPCSYLEDRQAVTAFVDPATDMGGNLYTRLSQNGFRRSGRHVYRPSCRGCRACVPVRVPVDAFRPDRRFRKTARRNEDLRIAQVPPVRTDEIYDLYARYIEGRHGDGDMAPPSRSQFDGFLSAAWSPTRFVTFRAPDDVLLAVAVVDQLGDGLSAIYTFFEPEADRRSLGTFAILWQIEHARALGLPYVYLGYWIAESPKMRYKLDFRPSELFLDGQWRRVDDSP
jgi:arginyl-tRNA--protein-N-Asp/Glu arginylyltransferase